MTMFYAGCPACRNLHGKRYGKISSYLHEILYSNYPGPRNMPAKFQLNRHKIGELGAPKFGVQCYSIHQRVAAAWACWIELVLLNDGKTLKTPSWLQLPHRLCLSVRGGLYKNDRSAILALARLLYFLFQLFVLTEVQWTELLQRYSLSSAQ